MVLKHTEAKPAVVGKSRNHAAATPLAAAYYHRNLPFHTVAAPTQIIHVHPHFVFPPERRMLLLGLLADLRILFQKPVHDGCRIALIGTRQRFMRRHTPAFQGASHGPDRNLDPYSIGDQVLHRFPRPQCERQLQLIWTPISYPVFHGVRLGRSQSGLRRTSSVPRRQPLLPFVPKARKPRVNRLSKDTKHTAGLHLGYPFFDHRANDVAAQILLRFRQQQSCVPLGHTTNITMSKYLMLRVVSMIHLLLARHTSNTRQNQVYS